MNRSIELGLLRGRVFVELGWIGEAEIEVSDLLETDLEPPALFDALSLFAKIKHIKGELSKAIACWSQLHALSNRELARLVAETVVAPDRALGPALALAQQNRPAEARAWCADLAARSRERDPHLYKLGVIAGSWLAELCGDLTDARAQLEQLGLERGFAHDLDRLLSLVRVYDRLGLPDAVDAATKVCRHVLGELQALGIEKLSVLGQLAALERRAGRVDVAADLDAEFLDATRRRMHRASLLDFVRVAATEYLPIEQLQIARPADDRLPDELAPRERAIATAMQGEIGAASTIFARSAHWLDRRYQAELAALAGDDARAIELFLDSLRDGPQDAGVVGWLLDRHERSPAPVIADYWADPEAMTRARQLLEHTSRLAPQRPQIWRRLATLHRLADELDAARRCSARAIALAHPPVGRVLAAGVYTIAGRPKGLLHEVWVRRTPTLPGRGGTLPVEDVHGNITPELRAGIRNTFVAVREYARTRFPELAADLDDYTYAFKLPKEDETSGGLSAGVPSALAFLSTFLQRPVAPTIAASGVLICEAHDVLTVGRIGDAEHKVKAAYHGNMRTLILPLANRAELEQSTFVPPAITRDVVRYVADLDQAVTLAFGIDVLRAAS